MMRKLLLVLVMMTVLYSVKDDRVVQVTIVVPSRVIAYYELLADSLQRELAPETPNPLEENIQHGRNDFLPTSKETLITGV